MPHSERRGRLCSPAMPGLCFQWHWASMFNVHPAGQIIQCTVRGQGCTIRTQLLPPASLARGPSLNFRDLGDMAEQKEEEEKAVTCFGEVSFARCSRKRLALNALPKALYKDFDRQCNSTTAPRRLHCSPACCCCELLPLLGIPWLTGRKSSVPR